MVEAAFWRTKRSSSQRSTGMPRILPSSILTWVWPLAINLSSPLPTRRSRLPVDWLRITR